MYEEEYEGDSEENNIREGNQENETDDRFESMELKTT